MKAIFVFLSSILLATQAHAFITGIDVKELNGYTTIVRAADYDFDQLKGKYLAYRGQPTEAANLFAAIARRQLPEGLYDITEEINEKTGTVSITVRVQGFMGWDYSFWILPKAED